jgi:hypothetical protein
MGQAACYACRATPGETTGADGPTLVHRAD